MNMENIERILPAIPEDFLSGIEIDGAWFPDIEKYKPLMKALYVSDKTRNLLNLKISRVQKKELLLKIFKSKKDILSLEFISTLKTILPDGLCYRDICSDREYDALKKEFNS